MTDKVSANHQSKQVDKLALKDRELDDVAAFLFREAEDGLRAPVRFAIDVADRIHDNTAELIGCALGDGAREDHSVRLEREAFEALKVGHVDAARHILKRDLAYTLWTQGYDDEDSQRLLKEMEELR